MVRTMRNINSRTHNSQLQYLIWWYFNFQKGIMFFLFFSRIYNLQEPHQLYNDMKHLLTFTNDVQSDLNSGMLQKYIAVALTLYQV